MKTSGWLPDSLNIKHLLAVLMALNAADALVSLALLQFGLGYEGNPFLRDLSTQNFLLVKAAGGAMLAFIFWHIYQRRPALAEKAATVAIGVFTAIVYWNLSIFLTA